MRARAARTSSSVGGSMCRMPRSAELDVDARLRAARFGVEEVRGGEILDREPERLEQRDVAVALPAGRLADQHFADFAEDMVGRDLAVLDRRDDVAPLLERRPSAIDI